ncbi:MAG: phosphotransferase [Gammaproteobacteria bacterium]|nr:phosphotransferase [Gammaproteobacteria bacterium]
MNLFSDPRLQQLAQWLHDDLRITKFNLAPASTDASFRRYFRVTYGGTSRIVMDAPPGQEDCLPYITIAQALLGIGLNVPEIIEARLDQGFLLLSDLGTRQYLGALNEGSVEQLYGDALQAVLRLQSAPKPEEIELPLYDYALLSRELGIFREWFLQRHLNLPVDDEQAHILTTVFERLILSALEQPRVWVHRDYHSRNLMVTSERNPGILDFQDAVEGPVTYDLVSLLRDCYVAWPTARVLAWADQYRQRAEEKGILQAVEPLQFKRWFDWMGAQRHLKAIGIFARLLHRDGKPGYLKDIPRTLNYVLGVCREYPELQPLAQLLERAVLPRLDMQNGAAL